MRVDLQPRPFAPPLWLLVVCTVLLLWIYTYRIADNPLKWEEPRRAIVTMEMIHSGNYVVPTVLGEPYLKKPPLQNWLLTLAAGNDADRVDAVRIRLISLLALAGSCLYLWKLGLDARGSPSALAVLIFLTMGTVLQSGRSGEIDTLFCFFIVAALAWVELGRRRRSAFLQWFVPQIFVAAGVLTKVVAPLFFYPPVLYWAWRRRAEARFSPWAFGLGALAAAAIVAGWMVPYSMLRPASDLTSRWMLEVFVRTVGQDAGAIALHVVTYPLLLVLWMLPWSLYPLALGREAWRRTRDAATRDPWLGLCATFVVWGALVFLFVPEQKSRYLLPIVPFLSVLIGSLLNSSGAGVRARAFVATVSRWWFWLAAAVVWVAASVTVGADVLPGASLTLAAIPLALGVVALACFAAVMVSGRLRTPAGALLALGLLYGVAYSGFSEVREAARNARFVRAAADLAPYVGDERPVVCHRAVSLKFAYELGRRIGRPLRRDAGRSGSAYWVAPVEPGEVAVGTLLAVSSPYVLWEVDEPEAWSRLGAPLFPAPIDEQTLATRLAQLSAAREDYEDHTNSADAVVWLGRRTAYLGHYRKAIDIYDKGILRHPDDPHLYRHRGHRFITLRRLDEAVQDLEHAARLIDGRPDEVEPDGLPNARNIPTSTLGTNVWYHLGLAHYLRGDLANAERCYRRCLELSKNPDMLVATTYWLYMTLRREGRHAEASGVLEPIHPEMDVIENVAYHRLLLLYRGELAPDEVTPDGVDAIQVPTVGYGIANWHLVEGRRDEAIRLMQEIVAGGQWAAFGYLAAEADLARVMDRAL